MKKKKIEIEVVEFDPELYEKNLKENEEFTKDPDGIGGEDDEDHAASDAAKPV